MGLPSNIDNATLRSIVATLLGQNSNELEGSLIELKRRFSGIPWNFVLGQAAVSGQGGLVDVGGFPISGGSGVGGNVSTLVAVDASGRIKILPRLSTFQVVSNPAVNVAASASQAAGGANVRNVATLLVAEVLCPAGSGGSIDTISLRDGASGLGTILLAVKLNVPGAGTDRVIIPLPAPVVGSVNTAMTWEFGGVPGATNFATCNLVGFTLGAADGN